MKIHKKHHKPIIIVSIVCLVLMFMSYSVGRAQGVEEGRLMNDYNYKKIAIDYCELVNKYVTLANKESKLINILDPSIHITTLSNVSCDI